MKPKLTTKDERKLDSRPHRKDSNKTDKAAVPSSNPELEDEDTEVAPVTPADTEEQMEKTDDDGMSDENAPRKASGR